MIPAYRRFTPLFGALSFAAALGVSLGSVTVSAGPPDRQALTFGIDVMAVLSKAGCNQGVCHGNKFGKGGFKLSLRGDDPQADFAVLTRDHSGRRTNAVDPDRSLLLLKGSMQIPHEGGRRFRVDSPEYFVVRNWIAAGMPADEPDRPHVARLSVDPTEAYVTAPADQVALRVTALLSDGTERDVTVQATYELSHPLAEVDPAGLVRRRGFGETTVIVRFVDRQVPARIAFIPERSDFVWNGPIPAGFVDQALFEKLKRLRRNPAPLAGDSVFLRRAFLDLLGIVPTADEARRFVADTRPDKRAVLIDELLERPEFADHWALKWSDILRNEEKTLDRKGVQNFHEWIRLAIAEGRPLDQFVRELIAARGSTYSHPPANYWRAMREPFMRAESTAQIFLGIRLQCAKCHNHPFDRWTQADYYGWANLFARVDYRIIENNRQDKNDSHEFDGEQIVFMSRKGEVKDPRSGQPAPARFLSSEAKPVPAEADRLLALADWLTSPDNRLFVEAQVNRVWYHLLGQGIVDPIDDFRATNPPSHPQLLSALAEEFVAHGFNLRRLIRTIMNSHTYQASSAPEATHAEDSTGFSHAREQRLSAETLLDGYSRVTEFPLRFSGYPVGTRAGELPGGQTDGGRNARRTPTEQFLKLFGKPPRLQSCECERTNDSTLSQAFQLVSGELVNEMLAARDNRLGRLLAAGKSDGEIVDELYWGALSRAPTDEEAHSALRYVSGSTERRSRLEDLLWGLLNSHEFLMRR